jgi:hypothetical protein
VDRIACLAVTLFPLFLFSCAGALAGTPSPSPSSLPPPAFKAVIRSLEGQANGVELTRPDGFKHVASAGIEIPEGSSIATHEASLVLRFADGSELRIAPDTRVLVESARPGRISSLLTSGHVRAKVAKPALPLPPVPKARFILRTKGAWMGVRGTDFTVDAALDLPSEYYSDPESFSETTLADATEIHVRTLEGTVEVRAFEVAAEARPTYVISAGEGVDLKGRKGGEVFKFQLSDYDRAIKPASPPPPERPKTFWTRLWSSFLGIFTVLWSWLHRLTGG